jgi:hypothetical protein
MQKNRFFDVLFGACVLAALFLVVPLLPVRGIRAAAPQASVYRILRRIRVGGEGRWDYLRVDPDTHRLFISRGTHVMIVDENSGKVLGDIPDTNGVHGIALAQDLGKGFTSNGGADSVTIFDLQSYKPLASIKTTGNNPDSIIYDPQTKRVFTFNGKSANATAIDGSTGTIVGTVPLGGKPEEAALDGQGNVFVNLEDKNSMVEFDARSLVLKGSWPLAPCDGPSALAYDNRNRRLFVACDKTLTVVNADTGKVVATPSIAGDPDGAGFDPSLGLIFATCREGFVTVIHQDSADRYTVVGNIATQFGARTMTLDPKTHHIFTVTADFKPAAPPTPDNPQARPQPIDGSFVILELGQ